jgi:hypothetical protein
MHQRDVHRRQLVGGGGVLRRQNSVTPSAFPGLGANVLSPSASATQRSAFGAQPNFVRLPVVKPLNWKPPEPTSKAINGPESGLPEIFASGTLLQNTCQFWPSAFIRSKPLPMRVATNVPPSQMASEIPRHFELVGNVDGGGCC